MNYEEIINVYLEACKVPCDKGGYSRLGFDKENIRKLTLSHFSGNGYDRVQVSKIVDICERELFGFFDELFCERNIRISEWPRERPEELEELRGRINQRINTALQQF